MKMQKKINAAILIFDVILGLLLLFILANKQGEFVVGVLSQKVAYSESAEQKKIAITFDDDVIIGLSQEISYKEAVSMI